MDHSLARKSLSEGPESFSASGDTIGPEEVKTHPTFVDLLPVAKDMLDNLTQGMRVDGYYESEPIVRGTWQGQADQKVYKIRKIRRVGTPQIADVSDDRMSINKAYKLIRDDGVWDRGQWGKVVRDTPQGSQDALHRRELRCLQEVGGTPPFAGESARGAVRQRCREKGHAETNKVSPISTRSSGYTILNY